MPTATGLDHVVLITDEPELLIDWYATNLGLEPVRLEEWRRGEVLFASLRIDERTIIDVLDGERTGENVNHLCVVVDRLAVDELRTAGVEVLSEPTELFGAQGMGIGVYVRDPAGNTVELRTYEGD